MESVTTGITLFGATITAFAYVGIIKERLRLAPKPSIELAFGTIYVAQDESEAGWTRTVGECTRKEFNKRNSNVVLLKVRNLGHAYPYSLETVSFHLDLLEGESNVIRNSFTPATFLGSARLPLKLEAGDSILLPYKLDDIRDDALLTTIPLGTPYTLILHASATTSHGEKCHAPECLELAFQPAARDPEDLLGQLANGNWSAVPTKPHP